MIAPRPNIEAFDETAFSGCIVVHAPRIGVVAQALATGLAQQDQ